MHEHAVRDLQQQTLGDEARFGERGRDVRDDPGISVSFAGADLTAFVPASLLSALAGGFAPGRYTANLWPRVGAGTTAISDFAPDNSNLAVTATPEPTTAALLLPAAALLAAGARRRRRGA